MSAPAHDPSESLLQLELVRVALTDPDAQLCARPVDLHWCYSGILPLSMVGYRPEAGVIYYGASSPMARWLSTPRVSARRVNEGDRLVRELLFCVHDYLHTLAYRAIQQHRPELQFGAGPITATTIETHVFLHLLTEAVATVGLDYWYLCTFDLDRRIRIGTAIRSLTVSYRLEDEPEYRLFATGFTAQARGAGGALAPWASPIARAPDFRFVNIASVDLEQLAHELAAGVHTEESARFAFDQYISTFDYHAFEPDLRAVVPALRRKGDLKLALRLFRNQRRLSAATAEPRDLFFLA